MSMIQPSRRPSAPLAMTRRSSGESGRADATPDRTRVPPKRPLPVRLIWTKERERLWKSIFVFLFHISVSIHASAPRGSNLQMARYNNDASGRRRVPMRSG